MFMDPGSDDEDNTNDIVRLANKVQGQDRSTRAQALVEETLACLFAWLRSIREL